MRTARLFLRPARATAFPAGRWRSGNADIGKGIHESGVDGQVFSVDHAGFGRDGRVFRDRGDDAARNDNGRVFDRRSGDGHDFCAANGEVLRLTALCTNQRQADQEQ